MKGGKLMKEKIKSFLKPKKQSQNSTFNIEDLDKGLMASISPHGGAVFYEDYTKKGDGFEICIHIVKYPSKVNEFWLNPITSLDDTVVIIDIDEERQDIILKQLAHSVTEREVRVITEKKTVNKQKNKNEYEELLEQYNSIYDGKKLKNLHIRIYTYAKTLEELYKKKNDILIFLEGKGFRGTTYLNLQKDEYLAISNSSEEMKKLEKVKIEGKDIETKTLSAGVFHSYTKLNDPNGTLLGQSIFSGGDVVLDIFKSDSTRKFFNSLIIGKMGSGKSTFLKKIALTQFALGTRVRVFDASGEFYNLIKELDGKYINLDGSNTVINPFQILKTSEDENTSYKNHLAKLDVFFTYLLPEIDTNERALLSSLIHRFYIYKGLIIENEASFSTNNITNRKSVEYPKFLDFTYFIKESNFINDEEKKQKLLLLLERVVRNYDLLFNSNSSTEDITSSEIVAFNVKKLLEFPAEISNAVMFNVLSVLWSEMVENVKYGVEESPNLDSNNYLILVDESHRLVNSNSSLETITFYENFNREARKYNAGIMYSTHLIDDFISSSSDKMQKLFQLTQYKFLFKSDSFSKKTYEKVFANELRETEINLLPRLKVGQCILSISGHSNIPIQISLGSKYEEDLIATGGK